MSQRIELDSLRLSASSIGLCLSVSSYLLTSGRVMSQLGRHELYRHVQNGHLWLLPPNIFYLKLHMQFNGHAMDTVQPESNILEYFATAICLSTSWDMLGLSIKCKEISYDPEDKGEPNLVFEIEHPDKSSALLCPPRVQTSTANGLTCFLAYSSMFAMSDGNSNNLNQHEWNRDQQEYNPEQLEIHSLSQPAAVDCSKPRNLNEDRLLENENVATSQQRRMAVDLAIAAIDRLIGVKKRFRGIQLSALISPTLLELAPSVCNAHYMQTIAAYAKTLSGISGIIKTASEWRPSLQQKVIQLTESESYGTTENTYRDKDKMQIAIRQKLWTLLHTSLNSTTGIQCALANVDVQTRRLELQQFESHLFPGEITGPINDREAREIEDIYHHRYEAIGTYCSDQPIGWESSVKYARDDITLDLEEQLDHEYRDVIVDRSPISPPQLNTQYVVGPSTGDSFMDLRPPEKILCYYPMQRYKMEDYTKEHGTSEDVPGKALNQSWINMDGLRPQGPHFTRGDLEGHGWGDLHSQTVGYCLEPVTQLTSVSDVVDGYFRPSFKRRPLGHLHEGKANLEGDLFLQDNEKKDIFEGCADSSSNYE